MRCSCIRLTPSDIAHDAADKKTAHISEIKNLIENAILCAEDKNVSHNKFDYFCYYEAVVKINGKTYSIFLNVGRAKNDGKYHLYDITEKIRDTAGRINGLGRLREFRPENDISNNSIPTSSENVKENESLPALTEPSSREIVPMPTGREATEDALRRMNGQPVLTGVQKHIESTAKKLDGSLNMVWDENVPVGEGRYDPSTNTIRLNPDSSAAQNYAYLFKHEFTHSLEGKEKYEAFKKWVLTKSSSFKVFVQTVADTNGIQFDDNATAKSKFETVRQWYVDRYAEEYGDKSAAEQRNLAEMEMVADYVGNLLFNGQSYSVTSSMLKRGNLNVNTEQSISALEEMASEDRGFIKMLKDFIHNLVLKFRGVNRTLAEDLEYAERYLEKVYKSAEVDSETEGTKAAIGVFDNGNTYVIHDRNVITATDVSGMRRQITDFFNELLEGKESIVIPTIEGDELTITKAETANKARDNFKTIKGNPVRMSNNEFALKLRAESHIDELAETSYETDTDADNKNHLFAKDGFSYRTAYFQDYDGQYYKIRMSVGKNGNIATIYNIGKIKEDNLPSAKLIAVVGSKPRGKMSSVNSIRQNNTNSQEKSSKGSPISPETDAEYLELAKDPKKNEARLSELVEEAAKTKGYVRHSYISGDAYNQIDYEEWANKRNKLYQEITFDNKLSETQKFEKWYDFYKTSQEFVADSDTFFKDTIAKFEKVNRRSSSKPDYVSRNRYGEISSEYWYTKDGVVRGSKHWGNGIRSCDWWLDGTKLHEADVTKTNKLYGFASWDSFATKEYVQNQKSADPVTYDDEGNVIPLSERFNTENEDIRYSKGNPVKGNYSYDSLISKPDMQITELLDNVSDNRAEIVRKAKENAAKIGTKHDDGSVSVYVNDIGKDVVLARNGLYHSLDRRIKTLGPVTLKAGEILRNSILINELTPNSDNINKTIVLIGAAQRENNIFIVESVINQHSNELISMNVLHSINAKENRTAALNAPSVSTPNYRSTISISELLDYVNRYFPDVLPEDVLKHYGHTERPSGVLGESALYSKGNPLSIAEEQRKARREYDSGNITREEYRRRSNEQYRRALDEISVNINPPVNPVDLIKRRLYLRITNKSFNDNYPCFYPKKGGNSYYCLFFLTLCARPNVTVIITGVQIEIYIADTDNIFELSSLRFSVLAVAVE